MSHTYTIRKTKDQDAENDFDVLHPWKLIIRNLFTGGMYAVTGGTWWDVANEMFEHMEHVKIEYGGIERAKAAFPRHSNLSRERV